MNNRRIFGIETEYGITCASHVGGEPPLAPEEAAQRLFEGVVARVRSTNTFLVNGARLYLDVGAHPEYASAECDSLDDLIANVRAGDALFAQMAKHANSKLKDEGIPGSIHLFGNNLDAQGNSFGCHENYLVHRHKDFRSRITNLIPFFVTRQLLVGSGFVNRGIDGAARADLSAHAADRLSDPEPTHAPVPASFQLSPRAWQMLDAVSSASTRSRPMINTRDEPHGDPELYRRMHVIVGDTNMSQTTLALKVGMTHAVLSAMEECPQNFPHIALADPMRAIREISADLTGRAPVELDNGCTSNALGIQREIHDYVVSTYEQLGWMNHLSPIDEYVFDVWERALSAFERSEREKLATEIEWVAKERLIRSYQERSGVALEDPRVARLELAWHDITDHGLRSKLEATGGLRTLVSSAHIEQCMIRPPQTTRAKLRGDFIAAATAARRDYMADWMNLRLIEPSGSTNVLLRDPFACADEHVDELMSMMR